jgi:type IV fimbrial biogenesis protein FimT
MRDANAGFSLLELLVTLTVAGILAAIATPSLTTFVQNSRETSEANSLVMALDYARSEAIKEDANVMVCASTDGQTCSGNANPGGWAGGWIVETTNAAPTVLQSMPALGANNTLSGAFNGAGIAAITFQPNGFVLGAANANLFFSTFFTLCDVRGAAFARDVEVTPIGAVQSSQTAGQNLAGQGLNCP